MRFKWPYIWLELDQTNARYRMIAVEIYIRPIILHFQYFIFFLMIYLPIQLHYFGEYFSRTPHHTTTF